jgi:PAS domain S-box-containing protein
VADVRRRVAIGVVVAAAYVTAAKFGFLFAFAAEQVTTVWAPTGISLAALLLWGRALWPAIWLGAFAANAGTESPLWTAAAIATGNTLETVVAASLLRRMARIDPTLQRVRDVVAFIVIGALMSTALSASVGVTTLCAAGVQPWNRFEVLWTAWWIGDVLGALVIAPVILTLMRGARWSRTQWMTASALVVGVFVATQIVFGQMFGDGPAYHPLEYVIFPFVIASAVKGGPAVTALVVLSASAVAIWNTVQGIGPFAGPEINTSLILLQAFMGVLAGTGLLLAAAIAERVTGERRRAAAFAVGGVLAGASNLEDAAPSILSAIGSHLEWQVSGLWLVERRMQEIRCVATWTDDSVGTAPFVRATQRTVFTGGIGLPGRVWARGRAAWIESLAEDSNFPRARAARECGLHSAFAFPIHVDDEVVGVIECFNRAVVAPDPDLLLSMSTVGSQIGLFLARKRQEAAVDEGRRRRSAILDTALDAVVAVDQHGTITEFNPAAVRMFGYAREEAIGRGLADLLLAPAVRQQRREGLMRSLAAGAASIVDRRVETVGYRADGEEFPIEVAITRVAGDDPPTYTGFIRDLTARVRTERERDDLLVREARARSEAEAANRAKDEFLATLSHELRTPLNAIVGWTHMLRDGAMDEAGIKRALDVIARNANLQAQLVSDILDVSRIITGGVRLEMGAVDLAAVIGAALDAVRPAADARQVQLRAMLAPSVQSIRGDAQRLQQVIWNLLSNAVKFTESGGVVHIELVGANAREIQITVRDTGAGIPADFLPHVFERFRQADSSARRLHGGLGLGLSIVRHLVELHGGTVRAESAGVGHGSTFTVSLPRSIANLESPRENDSIAPASS